MATIITDLKEKFRRGNICLRLVYINVAVFVVVTLVRILFQLFNHSLGSWISWLELPASFSRFIMQPWTILTYMCCGSTGLEPFSCNSSLPNTCVAYICWEVSAEDCSIWCLTMYSPISNT